MENLEIDVKFDPEHFREIYYVNGSRSLFTYKRTRNPIIMTIALAIVTVVIYSLSLSFAVISWIVAVCVLLFSFSLVYSVFAVIAYRKWKNGIESFIKINDQYTSHKIRLTESSVEVIQDAKSTADRWENIRSVKIEENFILLAREKERYYLFAAKSMNPDVFENLVAFIKSKVK
jgi:hypothetical protein